MLSQSSFPNDSFPLQMSSSIASEPASFDDLRRFFELARELLDAKALLLRGGDESAADLAGFAFVLGDDDSCGFAGERATALDAAVFGGGTTLGVFGVGGAGSFNAGAVAAGDVRVFEATMSAPRMKFASHFGQVIFLSAEVVAVTLILSRTEHWGQCTSTDSLISTDLRSRQLWSQVIVGAVNLAGALVEDKSTEDPESVNVKRTSCRAASVHRR